MWTAADGPSLRPQPRHGASSRLHPGHEEAKQRAPVDSGALRDSIKGDVEMGPQGYEAKVSAGDRKAFYWGMVEFGTSKKGARPYLRPGVQAMLSRFGGRFTSKGD
jgi:HK97 gp10 family phage protein